MALFIHHTDRGGQYAGNKYRRILARAMMTQSMSRAGDCYDNAFMESCFGTIKTELEMTTYDSLEQALNEIRENNNCAKSDGSNRESLNRCPDYVHPQIAQTRRDGRKIRRRNERVLLYFKLIPDLSSVSPAVCIFTDDSRVMPLERRDPSNCKTSPGERCVRQRLQKSGRQFAQQRSMTSIPSSSKTG